MRRLCAISLPIVLLAFVCLGSMVLGCRNSEREALLKLKHSLIDPTNRLSSWKGDECCHDWLGVACDNVTGHVRTLDLRNHVTFVPDPDAGFLAYKISAYTLDPSLGELRQLRHLDLSGINFNAITIPEFIGSMKHLRYLNLSLARFSGVVPPSLGNLTRLRTLDLGLNGDMVDGDLWVDDLHWVSGLLKLHSLDMSFILLGNAQESLQALGGLPSLSDLRLQACPSGEAPVAITAAYESGADGGSSSLAYPNEEDIVEVLKGEELHYSSILRFVENLDLSCNGLVGSIPEELTNLTGLVGLNLSYNHLTGRIPVKIGEMTSLESLDLSNNNLSGTIPATMSGLRFLSRLNLSHNKLHGEIPTGHQLQTLDDPSIYANNLGLCGDPLPKKCTRDDHQGQQQGQGQEEEQEEEEEEEDPREEVLFYLVVAVGFGTGFWVVLGTLWLNKRCRFALFQLVENITDYIYVRVAILMNKMRK